MLKAVIHPVSAVLLVIMLYCVFFVLEAPKNIPPEMAKNVLQYFPLIAVALIAAITVVIWLQSKSKQIVSSMTFPSDNAKDLAESGVIIVLQVLFLALIVGGVFLFVGPFFR